MCIRVDNTPKAVELFLELDRTWTRSTRAQHHTAGAARASPRNTACALWRGETAHLANRMMSSVAADTRRSATNWSARARSPQLVELTALRLRRRRWRRDDRHWAAILMRWHAWSYCRRCRRRSPRRFGPRGCNRRVGRCSACLL